MHPRDVAEVYFLLRVLLTGEDCLCRVWIFRMRSLTGRHLAAAAYDAPRRELRA